MFRNRAVLIERGHPLATRLQSLADAEVKRRGDTQVGSVADQLNPGQCSGGGDHLGGRPIRTIVHHDDQRHLGQQAAKVFQHANLRPVCDHDR